MSSLRLCAALVALAFAPTLWAQQPWTNVDSPVTQTLWGVAHGTPSGVDSLFVAVGEAGTIVTSPDGLVWTTRTSGTDKWLLDVTWSPTLRAFVAVGDAGNILTSSDGIAWTRRTSGSTQRLNSVAWSRKQFTYSDVFLAVGENGTALVSYDLETWIRRDTGVSGWLRGIATAGHVRGADLFIVTGHDGTILTSHDGADTFVRRSSGTTLHLDAVAPHPSGGFVATGANFVVTRTPASGETWTVDRAMNADGRENGIVYNGLALFNQALVAVGDQGRILDEAGRTWAGTEPLFAGWRAVAANANRVVAVGTDGSIATAPLDPNLALEYDIVPTFLADTIILTATKRRPIYSPRITTFGWSLDGTPLTNSGGFELRLNTLASPPNGTYSFTITGEEGASFTTSITLAPQPNPPALELVDPVFRPALAAAPGPILPLPDGRLLVAAQTPDAVIAGRRSSGLVRLNEDGSLDPTFAVPERTFTGAPQAMIVQPDGRIVVLERIGGLTVSHRLVRLNANGSVDTSFRPDPLLSGGGEMPVLLADGRWLAVERRLLPFQNFVVVLHRCNADGTRDSTHVPVELMTSTTDVPPPGRIFFFDGPRAPHTRDGQGRIYVGIHHGDYYASGVGAAGGTTRLFRLQANGAPDPTFPARDIGPVHTLVATAHGLLVRTSLKTWARPSPTRYQTALFRLNFDGTPDSSFRTRHLETATYSGGPRPRTGLGHDFDVLTVLPDGSLLARAVGHLGHFGVVRFRSDGELDGDFSAELGADAVAVNQIHALPTGKLVVAGTFRSLLAVVQPYLARLTPNTRAATNHLANMSVRARIDAASGPLIAGFVTRGGETSVLARGAGPALAAFGVLTPLGDPRLGLFSGTTEIAGNDNWVTSGGAMLAAAATRLGAFPFGAGSTDAALYTSLAAGPFTVQLSSNDNAAGVALAEIYAAGDTPTDRRSPRVINFSVRTTAGTDGDTLIAGFTLRGDNTRNLVIRAVGPSLAGFGITDFLPDPVLTVYRGETPVATSDDWASTLDAWTSLTEAFSTVGAFSLQTDRNTRFGASRDAAVLISLVPGSYTVHVTGKGGATGTALVETYEVP